MVNRRRDHEGRGRVNHKRVYRVMRDYRLLLRRHTGRPIDTRSHEGRIAVDASDRRWCSDGFEIGCAIGSECGLPLPWTAATEKR